jgi:alkaline phosphatase
LEVKIPNPNLISGGRCHFLPKSDADSCRVDDKDLLAQAAEAGYSYIPDKDTLDSLLQSEKMNLPVLGLFSTGVPPLNDFPNVSTFPIPSIVSPILNRL